MYLFFVVVVIVFAIELYVSFTYSESNLWLFIILQTGSTILFLGVPFNVKMMERKTLLILIKLTV